jgi:hypothetical protein
MLYNQRAIFIFGHIKIRAEQDDKYHFISDVNDSNNRILSI